ncbi:MAG: aminotransferase class V-fold PLP-dependent enzyme [Planctomycetes bacterium]|nr:aminotransferase class V-fold PLP-dependent enzyme [Planctomycetota bacterium]
MLESPDSPYFEAPLERRAEPMKKKKRLPTLTRRSLIKSGAVLALPTILGPAALAAQPARQSIYESLGLKHVINCVGTVTNLGGSVMPPEVVAAWTEASRHFVNLAELQDRVGERIAKAIGVEAALVTTGAAGALQLGTAAVVTRNDRKRIARLPDTTGMRNEVILQRTHHSCYDNQLTAIGVRLIDVETAADVRRAINDRTALMFFMNKDDAAGRIRRTEWITLAREHRIPTLLDAAADTPPVDRLSEYNRIGFDLVAFSGGKAIRGPNDTGLLLGRRELINAAKLNTNPSCGTIGRALKVSKEDMIAAMVAVERFVRLDHQAERREWERRIAVIEAALRGIASVQCETITPTTANCVPHLIIAWDEKRVRITRDRFTRALAEADPPIQIGRVPGTGERGVCISVFMLGAGEERIVAERVARILRTAATR